MKKHTHIAAIVLSCIISALCMGSAYAAEERTPIKSVGLTVYSTIESGKSGDVTATTDDSDYRVGDVEILNHDDDWVGGMRPKVSITLYAKSGYYFYSSGKSVFHFQGEDVTYVTSNRDSDKTEMTVTIQLSKLENGDLSIFGLEWDESNGTAMWDENPNAKYYQVRLFREGRSIGSSHTANESYYEFAGDITQRGNYHFEVRGVGSGSDKGDWESSDTWYVTSNEADDLSYNYTPSTGGGPGASGSQSGGSSTGGPGAAGNQGIGSWCLDQYGWWYRNADNSYPKNSWQVIDGRYYCFNESGYIRFGWILYNNKWYYCGSDGALWANCRTPDGFFVGGDGVWIP